MEVDVANEVGVAHRGPIGVVVTTADTGSAVYSVKRWDTVAAGGSPALGGMMKHTCSKHNYTGTHPCPDCRVRGEWIRADELLPPDERDVLVSDGRDISVGYYNDGYWLTTATMDCSSECGGFWIDIKYWMPLPAPPGEEE